MANLYVPLELLLLLHCYLATSYACLNTTTIGVSHNTTDVSANETRDARMIRGEASGNLSGKLSLFTIIVQSSDLRLKWKNSSDSCYVANDRTRAGLCVNYEHVTADCWDMDVEESSDCKDDKEICCLQRKPVSVDQVPCGVVTGFSARDPRKMDSSGNVATSDICWMAALIATLDNGTRQHVCDAVILDASHLLTPSECVIKLNKTGKMVKSISALLGTGTPGKINQEPFSNFREKKICGQEYPVEFPMQLTDRLLAVLARKGYAVVRVDGTVRHDQCTCRVCLPREDDVHSLTASTRCYVSDFVFQSSPQQSIELRAVQTNLLTRRMCSALLSPQNLTANQSTRIKFRLLCGISPGISGNCNGEMGGSITCLRDSDQQHFLVGLSIQPINCYSAPRLFRNTIGCYNRLNEINTSCTMPEIRPSLHSATCGRVKENNTDPFGLGFQTKLGSIRRHLNVARRMQMQSAFPVADEVMLGLREDTFQQSEIVNPGLHILNRPLICWEVAVYNPEKGHCSGALISPRHVITAAHCVSDANGFVFNRSQSERLRVFAGFDSIPREKRSNCEAILEVDQVKLMPTYSKPSGNRFYDKNDLALVEMKEPVQLENNPCVCTVCLNSRKKPTPGELCTLSGYGCSAPIFAGEPCPAPRPWPLTWSNVVVLGDPVCKAIPEYPTDYMACTVTDGGPSGCYGDSGGPLVCFDPASQRHYLHAIFSFLLSVNNKAPQRCRMQPLNPNVYTKVIHYFPWLIENVPEIEIL